MSWNPFKNRCAICGYCLFFWEKQEESPEGKVHIDCRIAKIDKEQEKMKREKRNAYERERRKKNALKSEAEHSIDDSVKKGEGLVATSSNDSKSISDDSTGLLPSKEQIEKLIKVQNETKIN